MIDIDKTIYNNVLNKINQLRYQAKNDTTSFKSILKLIFVNDMLEWAAQAPEGVKEKLYKIQQLLILCDSHITPEYEDTSLAYVNVNTPQTTDTWKRVWDSKNVITISNDEIFPPCEEPECSDSPGRLIKVTNIIIKEII